MLVNGDWEKAWDPIQSQDEHGGFVRQRATFRRWITPDGEPGPEGQPALKAEAGRFHLYVAYICPWASRALMARTLKGLESIVSMCVVEPWLGHYGWAFGNRIEGASSDPINGFNYVHQLYQHSQADHTGRATVPVLWDKTTQSIVNNESADIMRIFDAGFSSLTNSQCELRPKHLLAGIEDLNKELYDKLNNAVYRAGFAASQTAYESAVTDVFNMLDSLENRLSNGSTYLFGDLLLETDIRLFVTLVRFDAAYHGLFKCNIRLLRDYPLLSAYVERVFQYPGVADTVNLDHIKQGYYSIAALNPSGVVPLGPSNRTFSNFEQSERQ